ncbi:MAG: ferrous iron transporter B [Candidatus Melainabacteria bacterium]|nr:ferrous iron transporter B [Candidatus Melainabacteria bacterium]
MATAINSVVKSKTRGKEPGVRTQLKIVLAGNPNVGKSVIFNALTGLSADVSNYPGTTIDIARGALGEHELVDTPGVYGVSSFNDEERAARRLIVDADRVVNVVSALSLERDLFLTMQLIDMGKPLIVVINQWDEARHRGLVIDTARLGERLGVPVITCVAVRKEGIFGIIAHLPEARQGRCDPSLTSLLSPIMESNISQAHALLILEGDCQSTETHAQSLAEIRAERNFAETTELQSVEILEQKQNHRQDIYKNRRQRVNEISEACVRSTSIKKTFSTKLGRLLLHPVAGTIAAAFVCYMIFYQLLGVFVAGTVVDITEKKGMKVYYEPLVRRIAATTFPCTITIDDKSFDFPQGTFANKLSSANLDSQIKTVPANEVKYEFWSRPSARAALGNILVGEYGMLTLTVTYLLGLLFPLVLGFYFGLSMLEDSGYLPRLAVLVDRVLNKVGLNGRAIIPLILGLGCVTMATITTRLLSTRREKIIATALLGVAIPCSAQLGVVSGTLARIGGLYAWAIYGAIVTTILATTGVLLNMVLPGKSDALIMDLPPMRLPRIDNVLKKTWSKSWNFLKEATKPFFFAGFAVSVAHMTGILTMFVNALQPITVAWLHLPGDPRIATTFVLGIVRRDFASFGLTEVPMSAAQALTAMIVITLFVPCIATVGVMTKERGPKIAFTIWFGSWIAAFVIGGLLSMALPPVFHLFGL